MADYPEVFNQSRHWPVGRLDDYQRHKLRVLTTYNQGLGRLGAADIGLIWRYNSGLTYSLARECRAEPDTARHRGCSRLRRPAWRPECSVYYGARRYRAIPRYGLGPGRELQHPGWSAVRPIRLEVLNIANDQKLVGYDTSSSRTGTAPSTRSVFRRPTRRARTSGRHERGELPAVALRMTGGRSFLVAAGGSAWNPVNRQPGVHRGSALGCRILRVGGGERERSTINSQR